MNKEKYPVGSILSYITNDGVVAEGLVVSNKTEILKWTNENYHYIILNYPYGYNGVMTTEYLNANEEFIYCEYNVKTDKATASSLNVSSQIKYNSVNYLIIGVNSVGVGRQVEGEDVYTCVKYDEEKIDIYDFFFLKASADYEIITYGYTDNLLEKFSKDRLALGVKQIRDYKKSLPIGSIVTIQKEGMEIDLLIIGRRVVNSGILYDYAGVYIEMGYRSEKQVFRFQKNAIKDIIATGYINQKEEDEARRLIRQNFGLEIKESKGAEGE